MRHGVVLPAFGTILLLVSTIVRGQSGLGVAKELSALLLRMVRWIRGHEEDIVAAVLPSAWQTKDLVARMRMRALSL